MHLSLSLSLSLSLFETPKRIEASTTLAPRRRHNSNFIAMPGCGPTRARPRIYGQFFLLIFISSTREPPCTQRRRAIVFPSFSPFRAFFTSLGPLEDPCMQEALQECKGDGALQERAAFSNVLPRTPRWLYRVVGVELR